MILLEAVLAEHSKAQTALIVHWVGKSQSRFDQLFKLVVEAEPIISQRSSWPLCNAALLNPQLMHAHWITLLQFVTKEKLPRGVKRNTVKIFASISFPKKLEGTVMDFCFQLVVEPKEEIAVKSWAMKILMKMAKHYPDIIPELKLIVEDQFEEGSAGFKSQAKKILGMKKHKATGT